MECAVHPLKFFLDEIYEDYWGIPANRPARKRKQEERGLWMTSRPPRQIETRKS